MDSPTIGKPLSLRSYAGHSVENWKLPHHGLATVATQTERFFEQLLFVTLLFCCENTEENDPYELVSWVSAIVKLEPYELENSTPTTSRRG